jgi:hypothetical protein
MVSSIKTGALHLYLFTKPEPFDDYLLRVVEEKVPPRGTASIFKYWVENMSQENKYIYFKNLDIIKASYQTETAPSQWLILDQIVTKLGVLNQPEIKAIRMNKVDYFSTQDSRKSSSLRKIKTFHSESVSGSSIVDSNNQ